MFKTIQEGIAAVRKQFSGEGATGQELYVPAQGKYTTSLDEASFGLAPFVKSFAGWNETDVSAAKSLSSDTKVLLLTGNAGSGKSIFCQELVQQLWKNYKIGQPFPLWINLPQCQNPIQQAIEETLTGYGFNLEQVAQLKREQRFFFILDGYDELNQWKNLYLMNRLNEWQAKTLITCRSQALYGVQDVDKYFMPFDNEKRRPDLLRKVMVAPFSSGQIESYLEQFNASRVLTKPLLRAHLENVPGLAELITTPFLLHLAAEALPEIEKRYEGRSLSERKQITQALLYDIFIEHWFNRQESKLKASGQIPQDQDPKPHFWRYCQSLAQQMSLQQVCVVTYQPSGRGGLFDTVQTKTSPWAIFFETDKETAQVRSACPLKQVGQDRYSFWHSSLIEYFSTRAIYVQAIALPAAENKQEESKLEVALFGPSFLHQKLFTKNMNMLRFLADRVEDSAPFKLTLFKVIEHSKTDKAYSIGAANSISVLNRAKISFEKMDFQKIRIAEADLSYGNFKDAQFQRADLSQVLLKGAKLSSVNFSGACMSGVELGELPDLKAGSWITSLCYSRDGSFLAVVLDTRIIIYKVDTREEFLRFDNQTTSDTVKLMESLAIDKTVEYQAKGDRTNKRVTICSIAFSLDGQYLASGNEDGTIKLWNMTSQSFEKILDWGDLGKANSIVFSPDGKSLASGHDDHSIRLWNIERGTLLKTLKEHTDSIKTVIFTHDGSQLFSGSSDYTIKRWDLVSGKCQMTFKGHANSVNSVALSPNGSQLASGSCESVKLWEISSGILLKNFSQENDDKPIHSVTVAFHPNGLQLAVGSSGSEVRLWDIESGRLLSVFIKEKNIYPMIHRITVAFKPNGLELVAPEHEIYNSSPAAIKFWDISTQTNTIDKLIISQRALDATDANLEKVEGLSADNVILLRQRGALGQPSRSKVASNLVGPFFEQKKSSATVSPPVIKSNTMEGHSGPVLALQFLANGQFVSGSKDGVIKVWNFKEAKCIKTIETHTAIYCFQALPNGRLIYDSVSGIHILDLKTGNRVQEILEVPERDSDNFGFSLITCFQLTPNDQVISSIDIAGTKFRRAYGAKSDLAKPDAIKIWDLKQGKCLKALPDTYSVIQCMQLLPNNKLIIASKNSGGRLRVRDLYNDNYEKIIEGHTDTVHCLQLLPTGELVSGSADNTIRVWNLESNHSSSSTKVVPITNDPQHGKVIFSTPEDRKLGKCIKVLQGHTDVVNCIQYTANGRLISSSLDNTMKIWDIESGSCLATFYDGAENTLCLQALPNGDFVSGSGDKMLKVWKLSELILDEKDEKKSSCVCVLQ